MEIKDFINTKTPVELGPHRRKEKPKSTDMELNMTAMIDVLFMLILFFLIGARFVKPEGTLLSKMPEVGTQAGTTPVVPPITIGIEEATTGAAVVTINQQNFRLDGVYRAVKDLQKQAGFSPTSDVYLRPTPATSWNSVMQVYNTVLRAGYAQVKWSAN